jgi:predicted metal-dependent enzyme (double-stranded beta helix superfamily)
LLHHHSGLGFIVTLAAKAEGSASTPHHHGDAWSLYGLLEGQETVHRYARLDDRRTPDRADVRAEADHVLHAGDVEVEDAFAIHSESTASPGTIALIVRGRDLAQVTHEYFDLATGAVATRLGNAARPLPPV